MHKPHELFVAVVVIGRDLSSHIDDTFAHFFFMEHLIGQSGQVVMLQHVNNIVRSRLLQ